jgi:replicative DNA helicase
MVMVDHLLHVHPDKEYENEFRGINMVVHGLKAMARELDCPVICLTHRTRGSQDRSDPTPFASDFYGGGVIERACDALFCIFNRHRWLALRKPENKGEQAVSAWGTQMAAARGKAQVALLAHRHASFPHIVEFKFNGELSRFEEIE